MKKSLLMLALFGALTGCAGLDVAWELHATYLTEDLQKKRAAASGVDQQRQVDADRAAAALIAARNEAATK
jgi:hypothetical protein